MPTNIRDPRSIITPDAFGIDPDLLGTPLARPWPRLWALLIDISVIGVLNTLTSGLGVFIWGIVGLFLLQMAFRQPGQRMSHLTSNLFRGATGCLGGIILTGVALAALASALTRDDEGNSIAPAAVVETITSLGAFEGIREELREAETEEVGREILSEALGVMNELELDEDAQIQALDALVPENLDFGGDRDAFILALVRGEEVDDDEGDEASPEIPEEIRAEVDSLPFDEVLSRYAALVQGDGTAPDNLQALALEARIRSALASDTLAALTAALSDEAGNRSRAERRAAEATEELARRDSGFVALLRDIWDQAGSALGLWSIYFTVVMTFSNGFTVGKRLFGLRVLRLDGEPMTWWASFERAGGYVAGIATGLLGFAQVFWDPNRQCVHDKIGRTVVVMAGAKPAAGAVESSWQDPGVPTPRRHPAQPDR
jgi:uncharacterized RDD family membrane protein YckC